MPPPTLLAELSDRVLPLSVTVPEPLLINLPPVFVEAPGPALAVSSIVPLKVELEGVDFALNQAFEASVREVGATEKAMIK